MLSIQDFLMYVNNNKFTTEHFLKNRGTLILSKLQLTDQELQQLINIGSSENFLSILAHLCVIRPEAQKDLLYNAVLTIITRMWLNKKALPKPTVGACSVCALKNICSRCLNRNSFRVCSSCIMSSDQYFKLNINDIGDDAINTSYLIYDGGFAQVRVNGVVKEPVRVKNAEEAIEMLAKEYASMEAIFPGIVTTKAYAPSAIRLLKYEVKPLKKESYDAYTKRIDDIASKIYNKLNPPIKEGEKKSDKDTLKDIFTALGHGELLAESFAGDPVRMAAAFFPGKTVPAIIAQFKPKPKVVSVTASLVYKEIKS